MKRIHYKKWAYFWSLFQRLYEEYRIDHDPMFYNAQSQ